MNRARRLFAVAGIYGLVVLIPQLFMEARIGQDDPPAITHSEYFYGFLGVAIAWQIGFLVIATDPVRYRLMMIPAALEKFSFAAVVAVLYSEGRLPGLVAVFGGIDFLLGLLFTMAYVRLARFESAM